MKNTKPQKKNNDKMDNIPMPIDAPKSNQEHSNTCCCICCPPSNNLKDTIKKWIRDPNGWIALFTIIIIIIGYRTFKNSEDTAKRQLRAYVVPGHISFQPIKQGMPITVKLFVNNMGQSPAYNVSQACVFRVAQTPHNYSTAEFKKDTHHEIAIIGKEPIPFDNVSTTVSNREIADVLSKKYKLFYYAIVRYSDIFKQGHILHVCSEYSVESNSFLAMPDCNYEE